MSIDLEKLRSHIPDSIIEQMPDVMTKFNINTPLRVIHFLSQCSHESGGFKIKQENLNYSADGLKRTFPKYFPENLSESYAKQPEKIGSRIYGNRMGNGDESTHEGYKYRGRGFLQCTGKENYKSLSEDFGVDFVTDPDLVSDQYPLASAAWFFKKNKLLSICDLGDTNDVITKLTKRINGGTMGLPERILEFKRFQILLR